MDYRKLNVWASGFCSCGFLIQILTGNAFLAVVLGAFAIANLYAAFPKK